MKKLILAVFIGTCVMAQAKPRPYVSVYGGGSGLQETDWSYTYNSTPGNKFKYDVGGVYGAAIGTSIGSLPIRIEVEYSSRKNDINDRKSSYGGDGDMTSTALMVNLYYDFKNFDGLYDYLFESVYPYVFIGVGGVDAEIKVSSPSWLAGTASETVFAGQVGIGFGLEITDHIIFDLKGRVMMTEDIEFTGITSPTSKLELDKPIFAEVLAGIRFQF